jgi:hypothetical protein
MYGIQTVLISIYHQDKMLSHIKVGEKLVAL